MIVATDLRRRAVVHAGICVAGSGAFMSWGMALGQGDVVVDDRVEFRRVVAANRILANEGVVDAFGHVSVRDPRNPDRYVMSHARSPALVEIGDLMVFAQDGTPLDSSGRGPYGERMIHGAIYEARPGVNAIVHHHAYSVIPFSVTSTPLVPLTHTASVIGAHIPVWDIAREFGDTDTLVRSMEMGRSLAATLADNTCLLMRGHGAVVVGASIKEAVLSAVYLEVNARILVQTLTLSDSPITLSDREIELARETQFSPLGADRAWEYYSGRAGINPE
ncbi:MAG TPA: class II aldolase/adducin family protein [Gammaproteobacteria bacterium]|nr:class II aldolase/adducin family protein [Gammaproteobacteria bacterium]